MVGATSESIKKSVAEDGELDTKYFRLSMIDMVSTRKQSGIQFESSVDVLIEKE